MNLFRIEVRGSLQRRYKLMIVNKLSNCPLHEQIEIDIKKQIKDGVLSPGDRLLSVREMSGSLNINPNIISRSYKNLEKEEYIIVLPGKGIFVKNIRDYKPNTMKEKELKQQFQLLLLELHYQNISNETLTDWLEEFNSKVVADK